MRSGTCRTRPFGCSKLHNFPSADTAMRTSPFSTRTARSGVNQTLMPRRKRMSIYPCSVATGPNSRRKTRRRWGSESKAGGLLFCANRKKSANRIRERKLKSYGKSRKVESIVRKTQIKRWRRCWSCWHYSLDRNNKRSISGCWRECCFMDWILLMHSRNYGWQCAVASDAVPYFTINSKLK